MTVYDSDTIPVSVYMCTVCLRIFKSRAKIPKCPNEICHSSRVVLTEDVPKDLYNFKEIYELRLDHEVLEDETEQHLKAIYRKVATLEAEVKLLQSQKV